MGSLSNLKSPPKQTPCKILKGVLFKILQSSLFIRHYATNLALIQEKLEVSTKIYQKSTPFKFKEHFEATANPKVSMLFSAIILSSTTVIIGCLVVLITESLYNLLYNLPSAPPEMGGLLGQSKNTINTIFVDSGKISFRKSCQYVPNELLLNQTISDWDAQGIIFKGIFHTHKEGHGCQCLSSADIVYIRSIMNAYVKKLYFPIVIPHTGVFPYLAVYDQLSGLSITPEELNLTL